MSSLGSQRSVADAAVRSDDVVVAALSLDEHLGLRSRGEFRKMVRETSLGKPSGQGQSSDLDA